MELLIRGGTLVTEAGLLNADVLCVDGRIQQLRAPDGGTTADEVVDAHGLLVFPGFIDPHVHSRDPGSPHKETFEHSTLSALCGGTTTILEMPNAIPAVADLETFQARRSEHEPRAWVDFGLWGLALGPDNTDEIARMFRAGAAAVKLFWGYALHRRTKALVYNFNDESPENLLLPPDNGAVLDLFQAIADENGVLAAHCEDRQVLVSAAERLGRPIETYADLLAARPAVAESTSIAIGAQFARATGCRFHVVHMSSRMGTETVRQARAQGTPITAETCPQYLTLTDEDAARLGPLMKVYPPVRDVDGQRALWEAVRDGTISSVGSDHAPHTVEEKNLGFGAAPAGGVGIETMAPLLVDAMARDQLSAQRLSQVLSGDTARLYGLWPRKGTIRPGADADFTLVDPAGEQTVDNAALHSLNPASAWHGTRLTGAIVASVLGGRLSMRDGRPMGDRHGRFVPADHAATQAAEAEAREVSPEVEAAT